MSHLKITTHTANETNLDIELNRRIGSITIKCEVEILIDNGYGRLSTDTVTGEVHSGAKCLPRVKNSWKPG